MNFHEGNTYNIIKYGKGIFVCEISQGLFYDRFVKAEKVEPKTINKEDIKLPLTDNSILKKLY